METNSKEFDTIRLLQECDAGSKMAVSAIDEVLDRTQGSTLKNLLLDTKQHHAKLGNDIHTELAHYHGNTKEPKICVDASCLSKILSAKIFAAIYNHRSVPGQPLP